MLHLCPAVVKLRVSEGLGVRHEVVNPPVVLRRATASAIWDGLQSSQVFDPLRALDLSLLFLVLLSSPLISPSWLESFNADDYSMFLFDLTVGVSWQPLCRNPFCLLLRYLRLLQETGCPVLCLWWGKRKHLHDLTNRCAQQSQSLGEETKFGCHVFAESESKP